MTRKTWKRLATFAILALTLVATLACTRFVLHKLSGNDRARAKERPRVEVGGPALALSAPAVTEHRLLLDPSALTRLAESARRRTDAWLAVSARADEALGAPLESGYQGFEWADAVAALSLAWHATGDARYAEGALRYLGALLDDRSKIGDGKGGKDVVTHDSGYGIRTFGAYSALGYDWLRGAPGMDARMRGRILERLEQWLTWYRTEGYLRDRPTANYYWGYFTTLSFAGLAAAGESTVADGWLQQARAELSDRVLPAFRDELADGGWPEGWQYGEYTTVEIALVTRAFKTGAGVDVARHLPWLGRTVTHHAHALLPDGLSVYDGGTWGEHPAKPSGAGLAAITVALAGIDDARVAEARWLVHHALPPLRREQAWVGLLSDAPGAREQSPRDGAPTSLHLGAQGLTFVRSDWSPRAVWASFQAGPRLAEDHQDADQGHFELFRGEDALLVDGGDSEGSATVNHNTLLIDDGGTTLNYPPNQGVWGTAVRTTRFGDDGVVAVAVGDIGEAYAPSCAEDGCKKRSVERLIRTFVYLRPGLLVIDDQVALSRADFAVTWAAHLTRPPTFQGPHASAVVGASRLDVQTLEPEGAESAALHEPTPSGEGSHRANRPWGPMWRLEVKSPRGARERSFLHVVTAGAAADPAPSARRLSGSGLRGCTVAIDGRRLAVLFAQNEQGGTVSLGAATDVVAVLGLKPGRHYRVAVDRTPSCSLHVAPADDAAAPAANRGGFIRVTARDCDAP